MDKLSDLIHTSLLGRSDHLEPFLSRYIPQESLMQNLYKLVKTRRVKTDKEARVLLKMNGTGSRYSMLKQRLIERLYTIVLLLRPNSEENSPFLRETLYCHKYYIVAKSLLFTGAEKAAIPLLKTVLKRSERTEQFDILFFCGVKLRQQCVYRGDHKSYKYYSKIAEKARKAIVFESAVEEIYESFILRYIHSKARKQHLLNELSAAIENISNIHTLLQTFEIQSRAFRLKAIQCEITGQYETLVNLALKEDAFLSANNYFYTKTRYAHIQQYLLKSYLHLQQFDDAIESGEKALQLYAAGSSNWFSTQEHLFLLYLNSDHLQKAFEVYRTVEAIRNSEVQPRNSESWAIFWAYLWSALKYAKKEELLKLRVGKDERFRISKFLNEVPKFRKDKHGAYISIITVQFHILLIEKRFAEIIDKADALKIYLTRRLRTREDHRSRIFVKLLLLVIRHNFSRPDLEKAAKPLLEKLSDSPESKSDLQIEVISYERQWQLILSKCKN